ncbi:MAG: ATP--guanido phosphotransferase [Eubacterium sp.]|nr:ATP--guanido phosphotransferase [Eubacterium sp.]
MSKWYQGQGKNSDVVLFSRVRLARNIYDYPFPSRMSDEIRKTVSKKLWATVKSSPLAGEFDLINLGEASDERAASYFEKLFISKELLEIKDKASFMLSKSGDISVMLCEEDHIKINAFSSGQSLEEAYKKADALDDIFIGGFKLAFDEKLGFLTASPMNLGTGLKASFALHLPALSERDAVYPLSAMVGKLGLSLREMYPGGRGDIYILSNQVSLGITEKSAIDNLNAICEQIVSKEREARNEMKESIDFEDKIYRNLGIMKTARRLGEEELLKCVSLARLGASLGYLDTDFKTLGDMLFELQDATLTASSHAQLNEDECDKLRAQLVREKLN